MKPPASFFALRATQDRTLDMENKMKKVISYSLMALGFLWILGIALSSYHHTAWMSHSQSLGTNEEVKRVEATRAMRELSLNIKDHYRIITVPASLILIGGILNTSRTER
ncbi:hypothetical protein DDZ13_06905 [Coraliomargarita sinensis]|uniref:Uncharacterized protein n=1 Tax=Coraliomargarita sinensis TaxID=2174842 RepID=A0A317ZLK6_9BACT|nr:hypothetical protein [Coraliomargarita sinensis]PXA04261.1 hypothetical protein DDZ13_06905 [Coraliomargarita sinensis]